MKKKKQELIKQAHLLLDRAEIAVSKLIRTAHEALAAKSSKTNKEVD